MKNPAFDAVLREMERVHDRKNEDYAEEGNPYSNFEGAAKLANVSVPTVFQVLIGIKVERLRQLTSGKAPNFESIEDTVLDLANYAALWLSYLRRGSGDQMASPDPGPLAPYSEVLALIAETRALIEEADETIAQLLQRTSCIEKTVYVPEGTAVCAEEDGRIISQVLQEEHNTEIQGNDLREMKTCADPDCPCQALTGDPWLDGVYDPTEADPHALDGIFELVDLSLVFVDTPMRGVFLARVN